MRNLKPLVLFVFFLALACKRIFIETHSFENGCYRTGKYTLCRRVRVRVRASFSPEKFTGSGSEISDARTSAFKGQVNSSERCASCMHCLWHSHKTRHRCSLSVARTLTIATRVVANELDGGTPSCCLHSPALEIDNYW